jgi:hypothetical protein
LTLTLELWAAHVMPLDNAKDRFGHACLNGGSQILEAAV